MNKDLVKYLGIGAAVYFAWPYIQQWLGGLGTGATGTGDAAAIAAAIAVAAKKAADDAAAKAVATQTAEDAAKAAAAKVASDKAAADAAAVIQAAADARAAATQAAADARAAASVNLFRYYPDASLAGEAARSGEANAVAAANARGLKFNHHQWNWYRQQVTAQVQPDPELWAPGHTGDVVSVDQYLAARVAVNMSGLGELGFVDPILYWVT